LVLAVLLLSPLPTVGCVAGITYMQYHLTLICASMYLHYLSLLDQSTVSQRVALSPKPSLSHEKNINILVDHHNHHITRHLYCSSATVWVRTSRAAKREAEGHGFDFGFWMICRLFFGLFIFLVHFFGTVCE
jgi:hypothetical protein